MTVANLRANIDSNRLPWAMSALGLLVLALFAALLLISGPRADARPAVTVTIPAARAAALIEATSGEGAIATKAVGEEAKLINAAMPFNAGPIALARPFDIASDSLDHRRALLCLTQAVYYEAGFEPMAGRRAVAQVILNRMRHPAYPKSVCSVVYQRNSTPVCQFSFVCDGALNHAPQASAWGEAHEIAAAALAGYVEPTVGSATHYHADYVSPRWAPMLAKVAKLGAHIFYRWPGSWGLPAAFTGRYIGEPSDPAGMRPAIRAALPVAPGMPAAMLPETTVAVQSGPPIARAANDVGGLLDTTKGWTLSIPDPRETAVASREVAKQQLAPAADKDEPMASAPALTAAR
jgi:hypothetical protein